MSNMKINLQGTYMMQESHEFYRREIDKWILKEAKLRAQLKRAIARQASTTAARLSGRIKKAEQKQAEIMQDWRFFMYRQEQQCQRQTKSMNA